MRPIFDLSLYLVTDRPLAGDRPLEWIIEEAVKGGITIVQLREKSCSDEEFIVIAQRVKKVLEPYGVPLIINDNIAVALAVDAEGVHVGQSDMPYEEVRRLIGEDKIIGLSVENHQQVLEANRLDVDYIGISPVFATPTKTDTFTPFGLMGTRQAVAATQHPTVAIGGMNQHTIADVMQSGVDGVAVVSAIVAAASPYEASTELKHIVDDSRLTWCEKAKLTTESLFDRLVNLPFNRGLMSGTLPQEAFKRYLQQDIIYLANYADEMTQLARLFPQTEEGLLFKQFATDSMEAEQALHTMLAQEFGVVNIAPPSSVTMAYMNHTRDCIESGDPAFAMAAILPCIWMYNEIGHYLYAHATRQGNPYYSWIETYQSDLMTRGAELMCAVCNRLASESSQTKQAKMLHLFLKSVWHEYTFAAYAFDGDEAT